MLPEQWSVTIHSAARIALEKALRFAVITLGRKPSRPAGDRMHKWLAAASGGVGGAFGLPALALELPVSTTVMMRSIAAIAREEGEDLTLAETKLACVEVFALGGPSRADNAAENRLFRAARHVGPEHVRGCQASRRQRSIPAREHRSSFVFSARSPPDSGSLSAKRLPPRRFRWWAPRAGAMVNTLFLNHYQDMAHGHFIIRRLERHYGKAQVREAYEGIAY